MVENKKTKREKDIKSKLLAAIAMLLVSSIMMVSTTYAWFTLSTAPEVTGITTAVGANGNLEMALLPYGTTADDGTITFYGSAGAAMDTITSGSADSMEVQDADKANITWGNLVDLSGENYGMSEIVLYPSSLNVAEDATSLTAGALLNIPVYGADGRVANLETIGMNGVYNETAFFEGGYGVRAVGTSSGMSDRELAYRSALAAANSEASKASTNASTSLSSGGTALATLAMKRAMNDAGSASIYKASEVQTLLDVFTALKTGALSNLEAALRQYAVAEYLATTTDEDYTVTVSTIMGSDLSALSNYLTGMDTTILTNLVTMKSDVDGAITALTTLLEGATMEGDNETTYQWTQFNTYVYLLGDTDGMELNGKLISHWTTKDDSGNFLYIAELVSAATSATGLTMVVKDGVYYDIAQYSGNITASIRLENLSYGGLTASVNATMKANAAGTPYMTVIKNAISDFSGGDSDGAVPISDFYGYIIDLAFRTNAAESHLRLQTAGIDRIYSDNTSNDATMGGGATMTFSTEGVTGYNQTNLVGLMECIRVVFFDPDTMSILGYARLDSSTVSSTEGTDDQGAAYTTYTMSLYMYDETTDTWATSDKIVDLVQNTATAVSVLVYLDGENIENADVSTANIKGSMNLQFSSSADLNPMEYADLMNGSGTAETAESSSEAAGG